jgi:hypothetical protein
MSLAQLGRFGEAAEDAAEAIRLGETTHHVVAASLAYFAAGTSTSWRATGRKRAP